MNSTPNYHFEKTAHICGIGEIDRELRRVEDKVDCMTKLLRRSSGKPNCGSGYGMPSCNCEEELREIRNELANRYTKEKMDELLAESCDCDRYTRQEVDALLVEKAGKATPQPHTLALPDGFQPVAEDPRYRPQYSKSENGVVILHFSIAHRDGEFPHSGGTLVISNLPEGYRPAVNVAAPATVRRSSDPAGVRSTVDCWINIHGELKFRNPYPDVISATGSICYFVK